MSKKAFTARAIKHEVWWIDSQIPTSCLWDLRFLTHRQAELKEDVTFNMYAFDPAIFRSARIAYMEKRGPGCFDFNYYLDSNAVLPIDGSSLVDVWKHFVESGQFEDRQYRSTTNPPPPLYPPAQLTRWTSPLVSPVCVWHIAWQSCSRTLKITCEPRQSTRREILAMAKPIHQTAVREEVGTLLCLQITIPVHHLQILIPFYIFVHLQNCAVDCLGIFKKFASSFTDYSSVNFIELRLRKEFRNPEVELGKD